MYIRKCKEEGKGAYIPDKSKEEFIQSLKNQGWTINTVKDMEVTATIEDKETTFFIVGEYIYPYDLSG